MKKNRLVSLVVLLLSGQLAFAAGQDSLLEVTTKIEVSGMNMPEQTRQVCSPKGKENEGMVPSDGDCKMTDIKRSGNKSTFKIVCNSPSQMSATGEFESLGPDAYRGKMHIKRKEDGRPMDMTTSYSSKRIGSCTYEDPAKAAREAMAARGAEACREKMDDMGASAYFTEKSSYCATYRDEFCGRVKKAADGMRDPAQYNAKNNKWKTAMEACGYDAEPILKEACGRGVDGKNWDFVAENCPSEAKALSQQHCEGRGYTSRMASPYASICSKYFSAPSSGSAGYSKLLPNGDAAKKDGTSEALELGTKALKGLLNF